MFANGDAVSFRVTAPDASVGGHVEEGSLVHFTVEDSVLQVVVYERTASAPPERTGNCVCGWSRVIE